LKTKISDLHFDAEHVGEGRRKLAVRNSQINQVTTVDQNYAAARNLLGQSLHSIQVNFILVKEWNETIFPFCNYVVV
jgi:hypothetical protein